MVKAKKRKGMLTLCYTGNAPFRKQIVDEARWLRSKCAECQRLECRLGGQDLLSGTESWRKTGSNIKLDRYTSAFILFRNRCMRNAGVDKRRQAAGSLRVMSHRR